MSTAERDPHELSSVAAFVEGLAKRGWAEGRNLELFVRWGAADPARIAANTRDIVALAPDAILAKGATIPSIHKATGTIPIVFVVTSDDSVEAWIRSFARPAGNLTRLSSPEQGLVGKRLQLLREASPGIKRALYLWNPLGSRALFSRIVADAAAAGFALVDGAVDSDTTIGRAIAAFARKPGGGLIVAFNAFTSVHRARIVELAARWRLPAIYPLSIFARGGGLMSYAFSQEDEVRAAAGYVDRILRGARPGDLPVQEPTRFKLIVDLTTAKALGLAMPPAVLARADEVIQ